MTNNSRGAGNRRKIVRLGGFALAMTAIPAFAQPDPALNRAQVIPAAIQGCEVLSVSFKVPLHYVSHTLSADGRTLHIRLSRGTGHRAENTTAELIETVPPVRLGSLGVINLSLDNGQTDPRLTLRFPAPVHPVITQSGSNSIVISGISTLAPDFCSALSSGDTQSVEALPDVGASDSAQIDAFFSEARAAITAQDYARAVQLLTKLVNLPPHSRSAEAQELLGVARERNGQLAQAKAEYEIYLQKYPDSEGATRVRQRLAGVLTAQAAPPPTLRGQDAGPGANEATQTADAGGEQNATPSAGPAPTGGTRRRAPRRPAPAPQPEEPAVTGFVSSYYYLNQGSTQLHEFSSNTTTNNNNQVFQNALVTSVDVQGHKKLENSTLDWRLQGDMENDFTSSGTLRFGVSRAYGEMSFADQRYKLKLGRQKLDSAGVFGRFDGALLSWSPSEKITTRAVLGAPVDSTRDGLFQSGKLLFGVSVDVKDLRPNLTVSAYAVHQTNDSYTDRQAVGIEGQFLNDTTSVYGLLDYDTYFNRVNTARLSGTLIFPDNSSFTASADFLHSPTLSLGNALQGQSVSTLSQLNASYSLAQMRQLALDRTTDTSSLTLAYSKPLNDTWQLSVDTTLFNSGGTPASGGVSAVPAPGLEVYASAQVVGTSVFREGDTVSGSARIANTSSSSLFLLDGYTRFSYGEKLRLKPRLKLGYRDVKSSSSTELFAIPSITADYELNDRTRFELEVGTRVSNLAAPSFTEESNEGFASIGVSLNF